MKPLCLLRSVAVQSPSCLRATFQRHGSSDWAGVAEEQRLETISSGHPFRHSVMRIANFLLFSVDGMSDLSQRRAKASGGSNVPGIVASTQSPRRQTTPFGQASGPRTSASVAVTGDG